MECGGVGKLAILDGFQYRDVWQCLIADNPLNRHCVAIAPLRHGIKAALCFPEFLNPHLVSVIGDFVKLGLDSDIKV